MLKEVNKFGTGGHVSLPKEWIGKKVEVILVEKSVEDVKKEIIELILPFSSEVKGVYLVGSYARGEQEVNSDVDVLIIGNKKFKIEKENFEFIVLTEKEIEKTLKENAILILPLLREAKGIFNEELIKKFDNYKFNKKNLKWYLETTENSLEIIKESLENDIIDVPKLIYSLVLRLRGLFLIKNKKYSNKEFKKYLGIKDIYEVYRAVRDSKKIPEIEISKKDLERLNEFAFKELEWARKV